MRDWIQQFFRPELERAIKSGVVINLDNEHEMEMVDDLLKTACTGFNPPSIGLRINPVVGAGSIAIMSTATKASKFGLPITEETRSTILGLYTKYNWLNGIHFHVGSQGVDLELFVAAARFCLNVVAEIEAMTGRPLKTIDIGGGLSTSYTSPDEPENSSYQLYRLVIAMIHFNIAHSVLFSEMPCFLLGLAAVLIEELLGYKQFCHY